MESGKKVHTWYVWTFALRYALSRDNSLFFHLIASATSAPGSHLKWNVPCSHGNLRDWYWLVCLRRTYKPIHEAESRVERDGAAERSVLILARKLHKTKEAGMPELYVSRQICRSISLATGKEDPGCCDSRLHTRLTFFDQTVRLPSHGRMEKENNPDSLLFVESAGDI